MKRGARASPTASSPHTGDRVLCLFRREPDLLHQARLEDEAQLPHDLVEFLPPCGLVLLAVVEMGAVVPGRHDLVDETRTDPLFLVYLKFDDVPVPLEDLVEPPVAKWLLLA